MRLSAVKRVSDLRPILLLALGMGMIRGHDHRPQSSGVSRAWRSGGDRSPGISRITAGHGLRVLLGASVHKVRQVFLARPRGRPGGVAAPGRVWRCCEVAAGQLRVQACEVGDRHLGIPRGGELCLHPSTRDCVAPVAGRKLVLASVGGQFVGGGLSGVGGAAQEVGQQLELVVAVASADLVHRGVHPRIEAEQLRAPVAADSDDHGAAV
jgi:hypothetical protein